MSLPQRVFRASPARMAGVTLVELMIALVLGLVVTGAALALFATNKQTYIASESLGRIQESGRVAFELLSRDLRDAAGNPCDSRSDGLPFNNSLKSPAANWWSSWGGITAGVRGYAAAAAFPDAGFGTAPGQRLSGTEAVELKGADVVPSAVISTSEFASATNPIAVASTSDLQANDLLVLCDYRGAEIFQATGLTGTTISHAAGAAAFNNATGSLVKTGVAAAIPPVPIWAANGLIARLRAVRWYVGTNSRGGRSLYRSSLRNNAGVPSVVNDEIVEGLATTGSPLQLRYLVQGGTGYVDASLVPAADWNRIAAVRVTLNLVGRENAGTNGAPLQRTQQAVVTLRNNVP